MLTIRRQQQQAFQRAALRRFEDEMVEHIKKFAQKHCEVIGEPAVRSVIRLGMARAKQYGFTNRGPVRFYLELMFMFGSFFDGDPQLPWVMQILNDRAMQDQMVRAERLHGMTMEYLIYVVGPNKEYYMEALRRISQARVEDFPVTDGDIENAAVRALNTLYPQKCEYVEQARLRALIQGCLKEAKDHGVSTWKGVLLFILLAFTLGHGCASDPQFPWIGATLDNAPVGDPDARTERLYKKATAYLAGALG
jgi:hypothetical protein